MYTIKPSGEILGCRIEGLDLSQSFSEKELGLTLRCLADYAVVCFPNQLLDPAGQVAFSRMFGSLEVHVSGVSRNPAIRRL